MDNRAVLMRTLVIVELEVVSTRGTLCRTAPMLRAASGAGVTVIPGVPI